MTSLLTSSTMATTPPTTSPYHDPYHNHHYSGPSLFLWERRDCFQHQVRYHLLTEFLLLHHSHSLLVFPVFCVIHVFHTQVIITTRKHVIHTPIPIFPCYYLVNLTSCESEKPSECFSIKLVFAASSSSNLLMAAASTLTADIHNVFAPSL